MVDSVNSTQSDNNVGNVGSFNFKQKLMYAMKCITGDKNGYWERKIKNSKSDLNKRIVNSEKRDDKVNKKIGKLTEKYGKSKAEGINSAKEKLKSKNFITRNKGFRELRNIEKELIKNSKSGALADTDAVKNDKLPTFSGEQVGNFSNQLMTGIGFTLRVYGRQNYEQSKDVNWQVGNVADDGCLYSLVASKGEEDKKEVHLEDIQFKNTDRGIVAQFKNPYNEKNIITMPISITGAGDRCPPGLESYIKSGGGTYSLNKSDDGTYSLSKLGEPKGMDAQDTEVPQSDQPSSSDAEVTNIDGNADLGEAKDKEQILQECQQLIDGSVEDVRGKHGDELAKAFDVRLGIRLHTLKTSNDLSAESFKSVIADEKKNFVETFKLGYKVQIDVPTKTDTKAKASRMKELGQSIVKGAAKFGMGCRNVLSAIGNAFSNAGKKISDAISRAKSNSDGDDGIWSNNEYGADNTWGDFIKNDNPLYTQHGDDGLDPFGVNEDPFMNEFEESL